MVYVVLSAMMIVGGAWGSVSFLYHGGIGCDCMMQSIWRACGIGGELRGMESLCTSLGT